MNATLQSVKVLGKLYKCSNIANTKCYYNIKLYFVIIPGTHPEFEERLQQIIDKRDQKLERHSLALNSRQKSIQKEYETETLRIDEYYQVRNYMPNFTIIY